MAKASGGMPTAELAKLSAAYNDLKIEFPEQRNKVNNLDSSASLPFLSIPTDRRIAVCIRCYQKGLCCDTGEPCQACASINHKCTKTRCMCEGKHKSINDAPDTIHLPHQEDHEKEYPIQYEFYGADAKTKMKLAEYKQRIRALKEREALKAKLLTAETERDVHKYHYQMSTPSVQQKCMGQFEDGVQGGRITKDKRSKPRIRRCRKGKNKRENQVSDDHQFDLAIRGRLDSMREDAMAG